MSIAFSCPDCGKKFNVPDSMAGRTAKCSGCGVMMAIPNSVGITTRPSAKSRGPAVDKADDWQEEELPRKGRAGRRLADEEPEDEEGAPAPKRRKKRRKPAKKSGAMLLVLLLIGITALLSVAGVGGGVAWWYFRSASVDPLKFAPDGCAMVVVQNLDQIENSKAYDTLNRNASLFNSQSDDPLEKIYETPTLKNAGLSQVVEAYANTRLSLGPMPFGGDVQHVRFVTTKNAISAGKLAGERTLSPSFTDSKVNGYTLYEGAAVSFCVLNKKQAIFGPSTVLRAVLQRDKKPDLSENMKAAIKKADLSKPLAMAIDASGPGNFGSAAELQWVAVQGTFSTDINLTITAQSHSDRGALEVKKEAEAAVKALKNLQAMAGVLGQKQPALFDEPKMTVTGSTFTADVTLKADGLAAAMKNQAKNKPANPPGNNPGRPGR